VVPVRVRQDGDTVQMLDLPSDQRAFETEEVEVERVLEADGSPWRPMRGAEVLVLGDSFSNIYSLESLGWGVGAGLAEHLSAALQRPVDRLVQNDQGSFATRAMLQRTSADEPDRLARTRLVVYQFATREFAQGDWRVLPLAD
jgi:alginate O-acetyltransferase complex protein AlgJ